MLTSNIEIKEGFEKEYYNLVLKCRGNQYDDFMFSLRAGNIILTDGKFNELKIKIVAQEYARDLADAIDKVNLDADIFKRNAVNYYYAYDEIGLIAMACAYYEAINNLLPLWILQFAVNERLLHLFCKNFINTYK